MDKVWRIFEGIRRIVVFLLGIIIIIEGLRDDTDAVPELIIGMVMVGILPIEDIFRVFGREPRRDRDKRDKEQ